MTLSRFRRTSIALLLVCSLVFNAACKRADVAKQAERIGSVAAKVQPLFQSLIDGGVIPESTGAKVISRCQFVAENAPRLAQAIRASNTTDVIALSAELIRVTETIISEDTLLIPAGPKRLTILTILVAADVALGIIADELVNAEKLPQFAHVVAQAQKNQKADVETIKKFQKKPRLRARDARTGRFVSLEYAKKNPETTVIERVHDKR